MGQSKMGITVFLKGSVGRPLINQNLGELRKRKRQYNLFYLVVKYMFLKGFHGIPIMLVLITKKGRGMGRD